MKKVLTSLIVIATLLFSSINALASNGGAQHIVFGPYLTSAGVLLPSPKIYHYAAGTTTLKNCWSDEVRTTPVAQPFIGDTSGMARMYCDGDYKFRIDDASDNTLYTWDAVKVTSDTATMWEGNHGTAYPSASSANSWQIFAKHTSGNVFQELGINNGTSFEKLTFSGVLGFLNVKESPYNAKGDGVTNDRTAVQNAINDASAAGGGVVYFPPGTYILSGVAATDPQITLKTKVSILGSSQGQTILRGERLFHVPTVIYTLLGGGITSGAITKGDKTITLSNVTGISAGDIFLIYSSDKVYWSVNNSYMTANNQGYQAEFLRVTKITGLTIRFSEPFKDSYTAANVKIINLSTQAARDIHIKNLTIDGNNYASVNLLPEIGLRNCLDCSVENVDFINMPAYSKSIEAGDIDEIVGTPQPAYHITLDKITIKSAYTNNVNLYGVLWAGPVADSKITNSTIYSGWHAVAHGGSYIVRNILTDHSILKGGSYLGHVYDVHTVGADCVLSNSTVDGVYIRGWGQQINDNTIYNKMNIVPGAPKASIKNNHIIVLGTPELEETTEGGWWAMSGADLSDNGGQQNYDIDIEFINNLVEMYGVDRNTSKTLGFLTWYAADSTVESTYTGFIITGNRFYDYSSRPPQSGADIWKGGVFAWNGRNVSVKRAKFKHIIFKDNYMQGPGTWIRLQDVLANTLDISGNTFEETTFRNTDGLYYGPGHAIYLNRVGSDGDDNKLRISNNILNKVQGGIWYAPTHDDFDTVEINNNHITITDTVAGKNGIIYLGSIQDGDAEVHVKGNTIRGAGLNSSGIAVEGSDITHRVSTALIEGNSVKSMQAGSFYGIETTAVINNIISGNRVNGVNTIAALHARDSVNVIISDNIVPAGVIGIITQGDTELNIKGNTVIGVTSDAIKTIDCVHINILDNHLRSNTGWGVNITGATVITPVIYTGNLNRNNTAGTISLPGGIATVAGE